MTSRSESMFALDKHIVLRESADGDVQVLDRAVRIRPRLARFEGHRHGLGGGPSGLRQRRLPASDDPPALLVDHEMPIVGLVVEREPDRNARESGHQGQSSATSSTGRLSCPGHGHSPCQEHADNEPMPDIELFNPPDLAPPMGFAHAAAAGDLVVLGGQTGTDAGGGIVAPGDLVAQFARAIGNVATALRAAGSRPDLALKLTYFVTDAAAYRAALEPIGAAYRQVFGHHYPATSLFQVGALFDPDALVEIECVAVRGS